LTNVKVVESGATVEQVRETLATVQTAQTNAITLMNRLGSWLQSISVSVFAILEQTQIPDSAALERLNDLITKFNDKAALSVDHPGEALKELPGDLAEVHAGWKAALLNQIPEATQTELQIVTRLIEQRDYVEATRQVIQIIEVNKEAARM